MTFKHFLKVKVSQTRVKLRSMFSPILNGSSLTKRSLNSRGPMCYVPVAEKKVVRGDNEVTGVHTARSLLRCH